MTGSEGAVPGLLREGSLRASLLQHDCRYSDRVAGIWYCTRSPLMRAIVTTLNRVVVAWDYVMCPPSYEMIQRHLPNEALPQPF